MTPVNSKYIDLCVCSSKTEGGGKTDWTAFPSFPLQVVVVFIFILPKTFESTNRTRMRTTVTQNWKKTTTGATLAGKRKKKKDAQVRAKRVLQESTEKGRRGQRKQKKRESQKLERNEKDRKKGCLQFRLELNLKEKRSKSLALIHCVLVCEYARR